MIASVTSFLAPTEDDCRPCSAMRADNRAASSRLEVAAGSLPRERFGFPEGCESEEEDGLDSSGGPGASSIPSALKAVEIDWFFLWEVVGTEVYGPFFFLVVCFGVREGPAGMGAAVSARSLRLLDGVLGSERPRRVRVPALVALEGEVAVAPPLVVSGGPSSGPCRRVLRVETMLEVNSGRQTGRNDGTNKKAKPRTKGSGERV